MADTPLHPRTLIERNKWRDYRKGIWGDSFNWSWVRPWNQLKYLVIHHTVTKHDATPDDIAILHKARGWGGIGYHFVITVDGVVHYVGDISTARANVKDKNEQVIGIALIGDFTKHLPSNQQIESAHDLCKFFLTETPSLPTLKSWDQLVGHKDLQATACPGTSWPNDMRQRIIDRRVYTEVPKPPPTPQPDIRLQLLDEAGIKTEGETRLAIDRYKNYPTLEQDKKNLEAQYASYKTRIKLSVNEAIDKTN
jgi:hypothetical protein